jgi:hypothetical protein
MTRYCGRHFSAEELAQIVEWIANNPSTHRLDLSREVCRMLSWYKADGGLKEMSCRVAMLRMHKDGLISLPPPRRIKKQSTKSDTNKPIFTEATEPQAIIQEPVHLLGELQVNLVTPHNSGLWNAYIERYHYLGYTPLPGAQLRYFVTIEERVIALLGFGASAWQMAPRDAFIGWDHEQRRKGLPLIVNNARFLILPWIQSKNLASKVLALITRQLPIDWFNRYKIQPVLMETLVDSQRFMGTCYRAANWIHVGQTKGRGKLGPSGRQSVPIKDIFLYPLARNFRNLLKNQPSQ